MKTKKRKAWLPEEDAILKYLREEKGIKRWKQISEILDRQYDIPGRNQKQCRDRYQNYLKLSNKSQQWTDKQQEKLMELHNQYGNKWVLISKHFPQRTGNFIKNKFYAKLRKGLRKINQIIPTEFSNLCEEIQLNIIFKISNLVNGKQKIQHNSEKANSIDFSDLLAQLLLISNDSYSFELRNPQEKQKIGKLIEILMFVETLQVCLDHEQEIQSQSCQSLYRERTFYCERKRRAQRKSQDFQKEKRQPIKTTGKFKKSRKYEDQQWVQWSQGNSGSQAHMDSEQSELSSIKKFHKKSSYKTSTFQKQQKNQPNHIKLALIAPEIFVGRRSIENQKKFIDEDLEPLIDFIQEKEFSYDIEADNENSIQLQEINTLPKQSGSESMVEQNYRFDGREPQNIYEEGLQSVNSIILNQISIESSEQIPFQHMKDSIFYSQSISCSESDK